ncbi:uncharacterized protein LOC130680517 isoform X3 [Manis pentadactyla]|uniref:uncharacterized protein LOC130680517 isoform X3 n=1 Tax=Manis pentadactyla TaxID=143292 RepID=UPI00255D0282|nr:uncharacterized protein LOC130680517 isoform X3 [Manis pentadactyla]
MLVPPAGTARFRCPPCFFPKVLSQTQQRKLPACARPLVSPAPPPPPSLAKAQAPSNSDRLRLPPAGSRGLPRQGPAPSSSRRPVLLAAAAHDPCRRHLARVPSFSRRPRQLAAASAHTSLGAKEKKKYKKSSGSLKACREFLRDLGEIKDLLLLLRSRVRRLPDNGDSQMSSQEQPSEGSEAEPEGAQWPCREPEDSTAPAVGPSANLAPPATRSPPLASS